VGDLAASSSAFAHLIWGIGQLGFDEEAAVIAGITFTGFLEMVYVDQLVTAMIETVRGGAWGSLATTRYTRGAAMGHDEAVAFAMDWCDRAFSLEEPAALGEVG
jgi:hypothetical protein